MSISFTDTHAHISMIANERALSLAIIIERCLEADVDSIITISGDADELRFSLDQQHLFAAAGIDLFCSGGIHPHESEKQQDDYQWLYENRNNIIAIGESGLDFHYDFSPKEIQRKVFRKMIEIAIELKKPLIVHARSAELEAMQILLEYDMADKNVLFHCYTGEQKTAEMVLEHGWYISISGIATFKNSDDIRDILKIIPDNRLLLETDSPFLAPAPFRGKLNTPALVPHLYKRAAEEREVELAQLAEQVKQNTSTFFRLSK